ncbi:feruloyl-CoA synthase [Sulfitobacter sp.]|jgi:feruloyl-CoA synthase|uniref:feruloyl-CoA synthase n=1 Tax=Sulfitobacter sp. TaxID=1903071 RepID=UPI0039E4E63C
MTNSATLIPHKVTKTDRPDGTIILESGYDLGPVARCTGDWLHDWAAAAPDRVFLAERSGAGWRTVTYSQALDMVRSIAGHLLARDLGPDKPILIISGNSIDHGLLSLAAQYVGVPTVPVAEQYSLIPAALPRLDYVAKLVKPGMVYASDATEYSLAFGLDSLSETEKLSSLPGETGATDFNSFVSPSTADVDAAFAQITPDTLAKILMTSGSTSDPKGVLTTQKMMTTNQAQLAQALPFVTARPPQLVDWLPWNHVFGGSHNFNLMLANGGSLYIDEGKPAAGMFDKTLANLREISGTISFNVPVGFAQLVTALKADKQLRERYFAQLDMIFYAGASLPQATWAELERLAMETRGKLPLINSSWGLTETAPAALLQHEPAKGAGIVGVPLPGVKVKLIPDADGRCDVRVAGPTITKGYHHNPEKSADAFDEEGFFVTGDAMRFVDPNDPTRGLMFDGRMSEDFKLMTGTWVRAAQLRLDLLAALAPYVTDLVLTGQGREEVGMLLVPNHATIKAQGWKVSDDAGAMICPPLMEKIGAVMKGLAAKNTGSASRVTGAVILTDPPSMGDGEVTAKGNLNFPKMLMRRAELVGRIYDPADAARISAI